MEQRTLIYAKKITDEKLFKEIFFDRKIDGEITLFGDDVITDNTLKESLFMFIAKIIAKEKDLYLTEQAKSVIFDDLNFEFSEFYSQLVETIKRCAEEYANN